MGKLSTHVLDVSTGSPAAGMRIALARFEEGAAKPLAAVTTNADGRTDQPLLVGDALTAGKYRLEFHVAEYFRAQGNADAGKFLDVVPIEFVVADPAATYHVPLLVSPWHYVTYRGS
jgi:5-hydroxyisourate hydrolase